tara:strand:+ start:197 stop:748 length:552 start_codon:yes stop_codon:yes gene_type:complete
MASHNTGSDSANTNVRAFLTKIGAHYLGRSFNHSAGSAKRHWRKIVEETFNSKCAYCGISETKVKLTMEHLIMFNRTECGLHHPGNVVPCCTPCNKREKNKEKKFVGWEKHLKFICQDNKENIQKRKKTITQHIKNEKYPKLSENEISALKAIAKHLYSSTQGELDKAFLLFTDIDKTIVNKM